MPEEQTELENTLPSLLSPEVAALAPRRSNAQQRGLRKPGSTWVWVWDRLAGSREEPVCGRPQTWLFRDILETVMIWHKQDHYCCECLHYVGHSTKPS